MTTATLNEDAQAILLLCSSLALPRTSDAPTPLSRSEWNAVARAIDASSFRRPGAIIGAPVSRLIAELRLNSALADRISTLLQRGGQLAIELERLSSLGIWILTRADEQYPSRLKDRLKSQAPPVLFGAGPLGVWARSAVAIVGSRDIDESGAEFARRLGERCAASGLVVISGAARGADRLAMSAALEHGGSAIGVLAESLEQTLKRREDRAPVLDDRLTLLTPSHPRAKFTVGGAMGRNKVIYALASWAVVVSSGLEEGGTWAGATENLQARWVPLFVRDDRSMPEGNRRLLERGARPFRGDDLSQDLARWFEDQSHAYASTSQPSVARETALAFGVPTATDRDDLFMEVWPRVERYLTEPRSDKEVAAKFNIDYKQAKLWLDRAVQEGRAQKLKKPVRYVALLAVSDQRELFDSA